MASGITRHIAVVLASCWIVSTVAAHERPRHVVVRSGDSIQRAIDDVADGGTVVIEPGVYKLTEPLTVSGKRVKINGGGADGPRRTELLGPVPRELVPADAARGLLTFGPGGGGEVEDMLLRGFDAGIVGNAREGSAAPLRLRNLTILDTGRGILWRSASDLTVRQTHIAFTLGHGLSWQGLGKLKIQNLSVALAGLVGLAIFSSPGDCIETPVLYGNLGGGIAIVGASVCIKGGFLVANRIFGIRITNASVSIESTNIWDTAPRPDNSWGDGINVWASLVSLNGLLIKNSARAGVSNFGGAVALGATILDCYAWALESEVLPAGWLGPGNPPANLDFGVFQDAGGNTCGCGGVEESCGAVSVGIPAPDPIGP
jgi:hypothetical protein